MKGRCIVWETSQVVVGVVCPLAFIVVGLVVVAYVHGRVSGGESDYRFAKQDDWYRRYDAEREGREGERDGK